MDIFRPIGKLALQVVQLSLNFLPVVSVLGRRFHLGDYRPFLGELDIESQEFLLVIRKVFFRKDCIHRALRFAQAAIYAFFRINN